MAKRYWILFLLAAETCQMPRTQSRTRRMSTCPLSRQDGKSLRIFTNATRATCWGMSEIWCIFSPCWFSLSGCSVKRRRAARGLRLSGGRRKPGVDGERVARLTARKPEEPHRQESSYVSRIDVFAFAKGSFVRPRGRRGAGGRANGVDCSRSGAREKGKKARRRPHRGERSYVSRNGGGARFYKHTRAPRGRLTRRPAGLGGPSASRPAADREPEAVQGSPRRPQERRQPRNLPVARRKASRLRSSAEGL